jgi:hypothetical protein
VVREPSASGPDVEEVVDGVDVEELELAPTRRSDAPIGDDALIDAKATLADALDQLADVLASAAVMGEIKEVDRANLAKYLTIAKLRLENAINVVRSGKSFEH